MLAKRQNIIHHLNGFLNLIIAKMTRCIAGPKAFYQTTTYFRKTSWRHGSLRLKDPDNFSSTPSHLTIKTLALYLTNGKFAKVLWESWAFHQRKHLFQNFRRNSV